ncbi:glycosyltransferase family 2 protein [Arcticibacter sp. MXS-1]|uniref:glycosyltransferase family 2 protein n=1 Tax=Arcticibacter sp. MXS-1 TaxID=3341726 RepID=UPI0035A93739
MEINNLSATFRPLISVITVTLNAEKHLERCIKSVLEQEYVFIEHIIMDGASTDGTLDILRKYDQQLACWKSEPDTGIYNAMNKALKHAKGDWIYFLGADDFLYPGFSDMISVMEGDRTIYYGNCLWGTTVLGRTFTPLRLATDCICHHSIFYPRKVFMKYQYNENYKVSADYYLNIQCWTDKDFNTVYYPYLIANFSQGGVSENTEDKAFTEDFPRILKKHLSMKDYLSLMYQQYKERKRLRKQQP